MKTITCTDNIFVNVMLRGKSVVNTRLTGFSSLRELMCHLRCILSRYAGQLLTLELRNSSKGWSRTDSMLFAA